MTHFLWENYPEPQAIVILISLCLGGLTFLNLCYIVKVEAVEMAFLLGKFRGFIPRVLTNKPLPPRLGLKPFLFF